MSCYNAIFIWFLLLNKISGSKNIYATWEENGRLVAMWLTKLMYNIYRYVVYIYIRIHISEIKYLQEVCIL